MTPLPCSLQLYRYLRLRRSGCPIESAAAQAGIGLAEAHLHDADERNGLLQHIDTTEVPHGDNRQPTAPAADMTDQRGPGRVNGRPDGVSAYARWPVPAQVQPKEEDMGRTRRKAADEVVEIMKPDFELAKRIYFNDIKPAQSKVGEHAQEQSTAYKEIKKAAHIQPQAAKLAFKLVEMEESKRDDFLRSLNGLLQVFRIFMPRDMVDQAEGKPESNVIPIGETSRPQLATIGGDDGDLAGAPTEAEWRAGLKEGDAVLLVTGPDETSMILPGSITFVDGGSLDVEINHEGETIKRTVSRDDVAPPVPETDEHLEAAE